MRSSIETLLIQEIGLDDLIAGKIGTDLEKQLLVLTMMMILYTHRHTKQDVFIVDARKILQQLGESHELKPILNGTVEE